MMMAVQTSVGAQFCVDFLESEFIQHGKLNVSTLKKGVRGGNSLVITETL